MSTTTAQSSPILGDFTAVKNNEKVFLIWEIIAGATCNGIKIQRSIDNLNFIEIGFIPGICGNISTSQYYSFTDAQPVKNHNNYYRLELGNSGYSQVLEVELISINANGFQIRPNPASSSARIYFENNTLQTFQLLVIDVNGKLCKTLVTKTNFFDLNTSAIADGIYFFTISSTTNLPNTRGKIVIQH